MHFMAKAHTKDKSGKSAGVPAQVYLTFRKIDALKEDQLFVNAQALYIEEVDAFVGTVDFSAQFDLVNGVYQVTLVGNDGSAPRDVWELGAMEIWFKEGQKDATNQGYNANYAPKRTIIAEFPPENKNQKNPIVSPVFSLLWSVHPVSFG